MDFSNFLFYFFVLCYGLPQLGLAVLVFWMGLRTTDRMIELERQERRRRRRRLLTATPGST